MNYINHYNLGSNTVTHKGKVLTVSKSQAVSSYLSLLEGNNVTTGFIPAGYEHRPDLISDLFYGTVTKDWMIIMFNNIKDPFQELNVGDRILIPNL